jgi:hypothetical protein
LLSISYGMFIVPFDPKKDPNKCIFKENMAITTEPIS